MTPEELATLHGQAFTRQRAWSAAEFSALLDGRGVFLINKPQAFALGRVILDEAELLTIATNPDHQRQGLGRQVLHAFHEEAAASGATRAFLEVAADNSAAIALYTAAGYATDARRPRYYHMTDGAMVDALMMSRSLPQG
jgi:ribosomal-protein-alanine N-acetyltransferase